MLVTDVMDNWIYKTLGIIRKERFFLLTIPPVLGLSYLLSFWFPLVKSIVSQGEITKSHDTLFFSHKEPMN